MLITPITFNHIGNFIEIISEKSHFVGDDFLL